MHKRREVILGMRHLDQQVRLFLFEATVVADVLRLGWESLFHLALSDVQAVVTLHRVLVTSNSWAVSTWREIVKNSYASSHCCRSFFHNSWNSIATRTERTRRSQLCAQSSGRNSCVNTQHTILA